MINVSIAIPFYFYGRDVLADVATLCFRHYANIGIPVLAMGSEGNWSKGVFENSGYGRYIEYSQEWSDVLTNDRRHQLLIDKYQSVTDKAFHIFNSDHVVVIGIDDFISASFFDHLQDDADLQGVGQIWHLVYDYENEDHKLYKRYRYNTIQEGISTGAGLTISRRAWDIYGKIPFASPDSSEQHVYTRFVADGLSVNPISNCEYATLKTNKVLNTLKNRLKVFPDQFKEIDNHPFIDEILELRNG